MQNKIKVLLLFSADGLGGAERSLITMSLSSKSCSYYYATAGSKEGDLFRWARGLGLSLSILGRETPFGFFGVARLVLAFFALKKYLVRNEISIIYVCGLRLSFVVRLMRLFIPAVIIVHGVRWNPASSSLLDIFFRLVEKRLGGLIDTYISNSFVAKMTLVHYCGIDPERVQVVYNGVNEGGRDRSLNKCTNAKIQKLQILTVANYSNRKGYLEYLDVIKRVVERVENVKFIFVGRDDMRGLVQRRISALCLSDYVELHLFQADLREFYANADIFVLPSRRGEGCPTVLLEAQSYGIPCIAYKIDGIPELITDSFDGYLVSLHGDELFESIVSLANNSIIRNQFGYAAQNKIRQRFSIERSAYLHDQIFKHLAARD